VGVEGGDIGNKNHICQTEFWQTEPKTETDRKVVFEVTITDDDGGDTVDEVRFRLREGWSNSLVARVTNLSTTPVASLLVGNNVDFWGSGVTTSVSNDDRTVSFYLKFESDFSMNVYDMGVYAVDSLGGVLSWGSVGRDFKVWDCLVGVSGEFYDATGSEPICASSGFDNLATEAMNFKSLSFGSKDMTVVLPDKNTYVDGGNKLVWANSYLSADRVFNGDLAAAGVPVMRIDSTSLPSGNECDPLVVGSNLVSAYDDNPALNVDFSALLTSEPWFQVVGAGAVVTNRILDNIPYSCASDDVCQPAISLEKIQADNGLVAAGGGIDNESGCSSEDCKYGISENWGLISDIVKEKCYYQDLYNKYKVRAEIGEVVSGDKDLSDLAGSGVVFVDGNVAISGNNNVVVGDFLMVVASGSINIGEEADQVEGVFVADGGISSLGSSASQLQIEGSLCSVGDINLVRSYADKINNNTSPATVVNFRPDFIFAMPAELTQTLSGWKEGN